MATKTLMQFIKRQKSIRRRNVFAFALTKLMKISHKWKIMTLLWADTYIYGMFYPENPYKLDVNPSA